ncbi:MAG: amino acid ABC transporter permease [Lachnospiraceae bacterium]|nr:amino acid ABC transporter permease [Lachnospiraceae bacterium]
MQVIQNLDPGKVMQELFPKLMGSALRMVLLVTIVSFILAILIGFILALGKVSHSKVLHGIIGFFQEIIRGTPLLVQLIYIYYVFPLLIEIFAYWFGNPDYNCRISSTVAGIIGLSINYGFYISEVIRSAIESIDRGQTEAALALGFSPRQAMFKVVIPQATRQLIPVFGNYLMTLVKDTSLMAYITAPELLQTTQAYISQTFTTIESYTLVAIIYLVISMLLAALLKLVERKMSRSKR